MSEPRTVSQEDAPCVLHRHHSPVTIQNEYHHPFPQAWQKNLWGEVRDDRVVSVCATAHNSVHIAISELEKTGKIPLWCVGTTRDLVEEAFRLREEAENSNG